MKSHSSMLPYWSSFIAYSGLQLVGKTNRLEIAGLDHRVLLRKKQGPFIFAFWHSRLLIPLYLFRGLDVTALVSQSRDGEYITQVMNRFQLKVSRGSASRKGAEGLLGLVRCLRHGSSVGITPDGPRGPKEEVQSGVISLAQLSGAPIIPLSFSSTRKKYLNSWDRFLVPLPFGTLRMVIGESIVLNREKQEEKPEQKRLQLQEELRRITQIADDWGSTISFR